MSQETQRRTPIWLMGAGNAVFGLVGGFLVLPLPQMLAGLGVPEVRIAAVSAVCFSPGFWVFLLGPVLDVRFSRRWYATATAALAGVGLMLAVLLRGHLLAMEALLTVAYAAAVVSSNAFLGWMASVVPAEDEARLSAWTQVAYFAGNALMAVLAGELVRTLPVPLAAVLLGLLVMLPTLVFPWLPLPQVEVEQARRLARESFRRFFREIGATLGRARTLRTLALFLLPVGSFALTNLLGGVAREFGASEAYVSRVGGGVLALAGAGGCLLLPPLARRYRALPLYLSIGAVGGLFTLLLLLLPRQPWVFALAFLGENVFQALAFTAALAIIFGVIGRDNPLAATQLSVLSSATVLPILYMGLLDGQAYGAGHLSRALAVDGGVGLAACVVALLGWRCMRARGAVSLATRATVVADLRAASKRAD